MRISGTVRRRISQIRNLLLYFAIPALGAVAPLVAIPAISSQFGAATWGSVAIAQSLGAAAAVVAELGWGVVGPQRVAQLPSSRRWVVYRAALSSKMVATLVLAPIAGLAAFLIAPASPVDMAVLAIATAFGALSPTWFFIGSGQPVRVLLTESVPRVALNAAAALALVLGAPLWVYCWAMIFLPFLTLAAAGFILGPKYIPSGRDFRKARAVIRAQRVVAIGRAISVVYTALPIAIVGVVAPAVVPVFAASDKLMRMALSILSGVPSRLQSWIGGAQNKEERSARSRRSLSYNVMLGLISGTGFAVLAPFVSSVLFVGEIQVPFAVSIASGALLFCICASRGLGLSLVASRRANSITGAISWAAGVGVVAIVPLTLMFGAPGAVLGLLAAEVTGAAVQILVLRRNGLWRR
jgi:O-antigen/teichoic acid export membrane protein